MNFGDVAKLFDGYNRTARLYPALIAFSPIILAILIAFPNAGAFRGAGSLVLGIVIAALMYLSANVAQIRGKELEPKLIETWGAWPTTILLRHRDPHIDAYTKNRYHAMLDTMCPDLKLPDANEEAADPEDADSKYRSATKRLIENRRDSEYSLVLRESAKYGFRRNLLGLKPIACTLAIIVGSGCAIVWTIRFGSASHDIGSVLKSALTHWHLPTATVLSLVLVIGWLGIVRRSFVKKAAFEYAEALLRTLDTANQEGG